MIKRFVFIALLILLSSSLAVARSVNSGAIVTATLLYTGGGSVSSVVCKPDGSNTCSCTVYDNIAASGKQIKGAYQDSGLTALGGWQAGSRDAAVGFGTGLYIVPGANSTCFVEFFPGE